MTADFSLIAVFTDKNLNFTGNTAAVVQLAKQLDDKFMQSLAADFNQPATTFLWPEGKDTWNVRWFAPDGEIDLCGHGSLAAFAFFKNQDKITLKAKNDEITGWVIDDLRVAMDLNPIHSQPAEYDPDIERGLGIAINEYHTNKNKHLVIVKDEQAVKNMAPDFDLLRNCTPFGYIVSAPAQHEGVDFVSRTIVPKVKQLEDPATGSSHAVLTPYWSKKLNKKEMTGLQLSDRGGKFYCQFHNEKVRLTGNTKIIAAGTVNI